MEIDISDRRRLVNRTFKSVHFLIAFGFLIFGLVEFVSNPPYFDGYGDAKASQKQLPEDLFQVLKFKNILYIIYIYLTYYMCKSVKFLRDLE